jgi:hypothetical protein
LRHQGCSIGLVKLTCPKCRSEIPLDDVNVAADIALCRKCGDNLNYSELIQDAEIPVAELNRPPGGAWFRRDHRGFEVGASTRSAAAFFLVPFMTVWSGFSLGGIYGRQIIKGDFDLGWSLFGIPFLLGTLLFGSIAAMTVCGKMLVRVEGNRGTFFTGVGPLGFRKRFKWDEVTAVRRTWKAGSEGNVVNQITLDGRQPINVGVGLSEKRLSFMLSALRQVHQEENWRASRRAAA